MKHTMVIEARKQLIVAVKFRRGPANDSPDFIWTPKKVKPAGLPVKLVVADKGYDDESNHEYAQVAWAPGQRYPPAPPTIRRL